jgi:rubrerythrin
MLHLIEQLKEQKKIEQNHVKELKPTVAKAKNKLVSALLESIVLDSMKHAALCQALIDVKGGESPGSMDKDMGAVVDIRQDIKQYIRVEADMLTRMGVMAREVKEKRVKAIIQYILEDEKRHHSTLQALSNLIDKNSTAFEEYLELFQKYMVVPSARERG